MLPLLPFGLGEAWQHAEVWAHLAAKGHLIGAHGMLIAATARASAWRLATANRKEFPKVPGLELLPVDRYLAARPR